MANHKTEIYKKFKNNKLKQNWREAPAAMWQITKLKYKRFQYNKRSYFRIFKRTAIAAVLPFIQKQVLKGDVICMLNFNNI